MSFNFFKYQRKFFSSVLNNYRSIDNPKVFLEISANGKNVGKLVFEVILFFNIIIFSYMQITVQKQLLIFKLYALEKMQKN